MADAIELVDKDYSIAKKDRISSTQIKTRRKSFESISRAWNKFRLSRNEKLLEMKKNDFVNAKFNADENSRLTKSAVKKLTKKSEAIAKLEEKIKIRSNEVVPVNYVNNRAIKIRKKMMENLVSNCDMSYSVDADSRDKIFENTDNNVNSIGKGVSSEEIVTALDDAMDKVSIDENVLNDAVTSVNEENNTMVGEDRNVVEATEVPNVVDTAEEVNTFAPVDEETSTMVGEDRDVVEATEVPTVVDTAEEVNTFAPVEEETSTMVGEDRDVVEATEVPTVVDTAEEVTDTVPVEENNNNDTDYDFNLDDGDAMFEITNNNEEESPVIVSEKPIDYSNDISNESIINNDENMVKVSKNNSSVAKIDKYKDEEDKFEYKPMTAEEIEAARKNIEYDKYEKIYAEERRKVPIISFKDIFKPISVEEKNALYDKIIESLDNSPESYTINNISNERYVPLIVPEREEKSMTYETKVSNSYENNVSNDYESDVSSVKNLKEQYLQLQRMLSSKEAKLKSINAQRNELVSKVADSDKDVENVNEIFKQRRMMMAQYINDIQQRCNDIDSKTTQVEEELDINKRRLEENMKLVSSTNDAIEEIDQLLGDNTEEHHFGRHIA